MEVLQKTVTVILNRHLGMAITFHDVMHRFHIGIGTGTNALEAKILKNLLSIKKEALYEIFIDMNTS